MSRHGGLVQLVGQRPKDPPPPRVFWRNGSHFAQKVPYRRYLLDMWHTIGYYSDMGIIKGKYYRKGETAIRLPVSRIAKMLNEPQGRVQKRLNRLGIRGGKDHTSRLTWLVQELVHRELTNRLEEAINERRDYSSKFLEGQVTAEGDAVGILEGLVSGAGGPFDETE